jgi:hypothetical protein
LLELSEINYQSINISLSLIGGFYTAILGICYLVAAPIVSRRFRAGLRKELGPDYKQKISYEGLNELHAKVEKLELLVVEQKKIIDQLLAPNEMPIPNVSINGEERLSSVLENGNTNEHTFIVPSA